MAGVRATCLPKVSRRPASMCAATHAEPSPTLRRCGARCARGFDNRTGGNRPVALPLALLPGSLRQRQRSPPVRAFAMPGAPPPSRSGRPEPEPEELPGMPREKGASPAISLLPPPTAPQASLRSGNGPPILGPGGRKCRRAGRGIGTGLFFFLPRAARPAGRRPRRRRWRRSRSRRAASRSSMPS